MKKILSLLFFMAMFMASFIAPASAKVKHIRSELNESKAPKTQNLAPQAAAAAKIDYKQEAYEKRFYTQNNLKNNYIRK